MTQDSHGAPPDAADEEPEKPPPDSRRGARQTALQALYWGASTSDDPQQAVRQLGERFDHSEPVRTFAAQVVKVVTEHQTELDELISNSGSNWQLERMARLDLLILRLALAEILYLPDVPLRVSLHEAVGLARMYSTGNSYAFVNGVLDAVVRQQGLTDKGER